MRRGATSVRMITGVGSAILVAAVVSLVGCATAPPVPAPTVSDAQRVAIVQESLDRSWNSMVAGGFGLRQPTVPIVRFTTPENAEDTYATCITAAGYPSVSVPSEGIVTRAIAEEDRRAFILAKYTCEAQYPEDPILQGYLTTEQALYLADYRVNFLAPCFRSAGYELEPSAAQFQVGAGYSAIKSTWAPYLAVREKRGAAAAHALFDRCPPYPRALRQSEYTAG